MISRLTLRMRTPGITVLMAFVLIPGFGVTPCQALAADSLYTVTVPLAPDDPDARNNAYEDALNLILIRVTGSDDEQHLMQLADLFGNPSRFVLRFRPGPDDTLIVSFDGNAIESLLRQFRQTIWSDDRPLTVVWLAVDWGRGEREIVAADDEHSSGDTSRTIDRNRLLRERVEVIAERRGIPIIFPLLDIEDRQNIRFSDIWGGFDQRLIDASRRYGARSILVGRVRVDSGQPNRWIYHLGEERFSWLGSPEYATHQIADMLAARFAIQGDAVLETYALTIGGIDSIVAYGRISQLMESLDVVEEYALTTVLGRKFEFSVRLYGSIDRLSKALELGGVLRPTQMIDAADFAVGPMTDPRGLYFDLIPLPDSGFSSQLAEPQDAQPGAFEE